jgi:hypothetical protein
MVYSVYKASTRQQHRNNDALQGLGDDASPPRVVQTVTFVPFLIEP